MKTWEYKIINVRSENYSMDPRRAEELNRLGDEGWELVSITSINFQNRCNGPYRNGFQARKAVLSSAQHPQSPYLGSFLPRLPIHSPN